ncbi:hypothetical protein HET73_06695, partial [Wolbachia endosymbiont of Atemnus politus]|uniref:hypothetical protein n=1 Tax=Wolbachia endosymbiont of Atemnus politus TaxID=2682840 RepID=UPI001573E973
MGAIKISKSLFNGNSKVTKHYDEPRVEKNLYTILGFDSRKDFENKKSKFVDKKIWQLFVDCFAKEIDYVATKQVVQNIVCNIAKSASGTKTERLILNEKQGNKKREKAVRKAISILREISPKTAFHELSVMKKQAEDFLQTDFYKAQSKPIQGFAPSGGQLFAETLKYIKTLEKLSEVKKEELVKDFLLSHVSSFNKTYPKSHGKREDAIAILSSDELKNFYDKSVEEGVLQPLASYKECKNLYDKMNQAENESKGSVNRKERNESKSVIDRKEQKKNLREIGKSIIGIINDIKKYREAILNCKNFQNSYIKEKEEHPLRSSACQKMIDIYQERIAGYQEKICQNLTKIREIFKSIPREMSSSCGMEKFEELM